MRTRICVELATAHGGDVAIARRMVEAAAESGADAVKVQHYGAVNPRDPQAEWLEGARLSGGSISLLMAEAHARGMEFWATPFNARTLEELLTLGVDRIKIASAEAMSPWWSKRLEQAVVSWPWGIRRDEAGWAPSITHLAAVPLYPTPLECVYRTPFQTCAGWSDHTVGLSACQYALTQGASWLEVHLQVPGVTPRDRDWEKTPADIRQLRTFAEDVETMRTGVSQVFRDRWVR